MEPVFETRPPRQALQPPRSNVPIIPQPGDAHLVALKLSTHRTCDERNAMRHRAKLQSPVDSDGVDSLRALRALRAETVGVLA